MGTVKKAIKYVVLLIVGLFIGVSIAGMVSGAKEALRGDKAEAIKNVLSENCECEAVNQFMYSKGIQFSKEDGLSTEKVEYELVNCKYDNILNEVDRINKLLGSEVKGYADVDLLKLEFVGAEKHENFIIKNGVIQ